MQSSSQIVPTNKPTPTFLQAGCPFCRPGKIIILHGLAPPAHLGSSVLFLTIKGSWLPEGKVAKPFISPLLTVPPQLDLRCYVKAGWLEVEYPNHHVSVMEVKHAHEQRSQHIMNPSSCRKPQIHRVMQPSQLSSVPPTDVSTVVLHDTSSTSNTTTGGGDSGYGRA